MKTEEAIKKQYMVSLGGLDMKERLRLEWMEDDQKSVQDILDLENMRPADLFKEWLNWEGIIGYTDLIIERLRECGYVVEEVEV